MGIEAWTEAFLAAQKELPDIPKTKKATIDTKGGRSYSYEYADLPDVLSAVRPVLHRHGLAIAQDVTGTVGSVAVSTRIYHESGHVETFGPLELPAGNDARAAGSGITYARRYAATAALGIASDEDDDGQRAQRAQAVAPFDLGEFIRSEVAQFTKWDAARRRMEWTEAVNGQTVRTEADARTIIDRMRGIYDAEHPPEVEGQEALL